MCSFIVLMPWVITSTVNSHETESTKCVSKLLTASEPKDRGSSPGHRQRGAPVSTHHFLEGGPLPLPPVSPSPVCSSCLAWTASAWQLQVGQQQPPFCLITESNIEDKTERGVEEESHCVAPNTVCYVVRRSHQSVRRGREIREIWYETNVCMLAWCTGRRRSRRGSSDWSHLWETIYEMISLSRFWSRFGLDAQLRSNLIRLKSRLF